MTTSELDPIAERMAARAEGTVAVMGGVRQAEGSATLLRLDRIMVDPSIQIRHRNDEDTIDRYVDSFASLPPIDVFRTPDGDILADGFHRYAAAERLGIDELTVTLRLGSRADAAEFAALANLTHGKPLDREERNDAIRRLTKRPDWTHERIAKHFGVSKGLITTLLAADRVRAAVVEPMQQDYLVSPGPDDEAVLTETHYAEISRAPRGAWQALTETAAESGWDTGETRKAVTIVKDPSVSEADKQALLLGHADLREFDENHRRTPPAPLPPFCATCRIRHGDDTPCAMPPSPTFGDVKAELVREIEPYEIARQLRHLVYEIRLAERWDRAALIKSVQGEGGRELSEGLRLCSDWLRELAEEIETSRPPLEVLR